MLWAVATHHHKCLPITLTNKPLNGLKPKPRPHPLLSDVGGGNVHPDRHPGSHSMKHHRRHGVSATLTGEVWTQSQSEVACVHTVVTPYTPRIDTMAPESDHQI